MQCILDDGNNLSNIESGEIFFKDVSFYQQIEKVSTAHVFKHLIDREMKLILNLYGNLGKTHPDTHQI
jgi:hypothetical protein